MSNELIFDAVSGVQSRWRDLELNVPLRYFAARSFTASFRTPVEVVEGLLPANVHPLRWGRQWAVTAIVYNDFAESDIGPYREILIGFPVSVDEKTMPFLGMRSFLKSGGSFFTHELVLDDQVAVDLGVDIAGYPKHMGELDFDFDSSTMRFVWREDDLDVMRLAAPRPTPTPVDRRERMSLISTKGGYVLRSDSVAYVGRAGRVDAATISLDFGTHERAEYMRNLTQGKGLGGRLVLDRQLTLSPPLEGWA
jgi:hypothetical protein